MSTVDVDAPATPPAPEGGAERAVGADRDDRADRWAPPTGDEVRVVHSGGAELHSVGTGPAGAPLVLFVHGYPDDHRTWDPVRARLADRYRVVTFDLRGMGHSRVPAGPGSHGLDALCADIDAVATAWLGDAEAGFHLVGHDWGSIIGWSFVADPVHARRVRSWTSVSGPHAGVAGSYARSAWRRPGQLPAALRQATSSLYVAAFQLRGLPERVWRQRAGDLWGRALGDGGVPAGDPLLAFPRDEILAIALPGLELYRQNLRPDRMPDRPADGTVTVPSQLVVALGDTYVRPPLARAGAPLCTDLVVREITAGHWVQRSHPDELAGWIDTHVAGAEGGPAPAAFDSCATPVPALAGRVVLVTGAGGGIGRATAVDAAAAGATLVLADRSADALARTAELCRALGAEVDEHVVDVTDRDAMAAFADAVHARHGAVDVLVNNAGVGMAGPFTAMSLDDWDWIRSVNLDGVITGCHLFVPAMVSAGRGGHVVNVASAAGLAPARNMTAYNATKFAVVGFSDALAADLAGAGVTVSAICPGIVDTGIIGATRFVGDDAAEETRARIGKLYRRRGFGPEKVSAAIWATVAAGRSGVVPVGPEAKALYRLRRFAPRLLARLAGRDLAGTDRTTDTDRTAGAASGASAAAEGGVR